MNLTRWLAVALLVVGAVAAGGLWYVFFRSAGPAPVALSSADPSDSGVATLAPIGSASPTSPTAAGVLIGGIDGTWTIGANNGSFVGYRVQEELAGIGGNTAVGQTTGVTGNLSISGTTVMARVMSAKNGTLPLSTATSTTPCS